MLQIFFSAIYRWIVMKFDGDLQFNLLFLLLLFYLLSSSSNSSFSFSFSSGLEFICIYKAKHIGRSRCKRQVLSLDLGCIEGPNSLTPLFIVNSPQCTVQSTQSTVMLNQIESCKSMQSDVKSCRVRQSWAEPQGVERSCAELRRVTQSRAESQKSPDYTK
jgi:hypothetical protein